MRLILLFDQRLIDISIKTTTKDSNQSAVSMTFRFVFVSSDRNSTYVYARIINRRETSVTLSGIHHSCRRCHHHPHRCPFAVMD